MKADAVTWKDEGDFGPVHIRRNGERINYKDSEEFSAITGEPYAEWYTRAQAVGIAQKEGLPFEEV